MKSLGPLDSLLEPVKDPKEEAYRRFAASILSEEKLTQAVLDLEEYANDGYLSLLADSEIREYFSRFNLPYDSKEDLQALIGYLATEVESRQNINSSKLVTIPRLSIPTFSKVKYEDPLNHLDDFVKPLKKTVLSLYKLFKSERKLGRQVIGNDNSSLDINWYSKNTELGLIFKQRNIIASFNRSYYKNHKIETANIPYKIPIYKVMIRKGFLKRPDIGIDVLDKISPESSCYNSINYYNGIPDFVKRIKSEMADIQDLPLLEDLWMQHHLRALTGILSLPSFIAKYRGSGSVIFPDLEELRKKSQEDQLALENRKRTIPELLAIIKQSIK